MGGGAGAGPGRQIYVSNVSILTLANSTNK